jgi:hypothetical protein
MKKIYFVALVLVVGFLGIAGFDYVSANNSNFTLDFDNAGEPDWVRLDFDNAGEPDWVRLDFDNAGEPDWVRLDFDNAGEPDWVRV